jgi:HTH-type transcriptional regulator/antitoxin HipB
MRQIVTTPGQVGEIVRGRRKVRRISQQALASQMGVSQGRFSILEGDPTSMTLGRLLLLAKLLGLEIVVQDKADEPASKAGW